MSRTWKILLLVLPLACSISVAWFIFHKRPIPSNQNEVLRRVYDLQRAGRYDEAVKVIQTWMNDGRRDISNDDFLYQQIAMIYIAKASKKPATRDDSIHEADMNLQKALAFYSQHQPKDHDVELFEIGGAYDLLGDLSGGSKCQFYSYARESFIRELPLVSGDSFTEYGHTFNLAGARAELKKHLDNVNDKYSKVGCRVAEEKRLQ